MDTGHSSSCVVFSFLFVDLKVSESEIRSVVSNSLGHHGLNSPWNSPEYWVGSLFLLQGMFQPRDQTHVPCTGVQLSSVQLLSRVWLFANPWTEACQPPCPSPTPRVYSKSCPLSWWCHLTISSSVVPFSSRLQSFPASGSFLMRQFLGSGSQSIGVSAAASVLPMNI